MTPRGNLTSIPFRLCSAAPRTVSHPEGSRRVSGTGIFSSPARYFPVMLAGFFRYNDMNFEQFAVEFVAHHFNPQKRIYEYEPIFMELRRQYLLEEYALEIEQNVKPKKGLFRRKEVHK